MVKEGEIKFGALTRQVIKKGDNVKVYPFTTIGFPGFGFETNKEGDNFLYPLTRKSFNKIVILDDDVEIGVGCCIDRGSWRDTKIGKGSKLDAHVHVSHDVVIGKHCVISAGVVIGASSTIGDRVFIEPNVTIKDHTTIENDATVVNDNKARVL